MALALVAGPTVSTAGAETVTNVLEQNWDTSVHPLRSEVPAPTNTDPLTGKEDQWLIFSGGTSARPLSTTEGETGKPDGEAAAESPVSEEEKTNYGASARSVGGLRAFSA